MGRAKGGHVREWEPSREMGRDKHSYKSSASEFRHIHSSYKVVSVNTKARRLAYLTALIQLVDKRQVNETELSNILIDWSEEYASKLASYRNQQGQVTRSKLSARRYIQFGEVLHLLTRIGGSLRASRKGFVLNLLVKESKVKKQNPFFLTDVEKLFYAYQLLTADPDFFFTVLDLIQTNEGKSLKELQHRFREAHLKRLSYKRSRHEDRVLQQLLLERNRVIQDTWKRPDRYAEHIVPPRLNWLLDLGLLNSDAFKRNSYVLNGLGKKFANELPINLHNSRYSDLSNEWLKLGFMQRLCPLFLTTPKVKNWESAIKTLPEKISVYLESAFRNFQMTAAHSIPLEESILYLCFRLATESGIAIDEKDLINWLSKQDKIGGRRYEIRLLPRPNESYIRLA